MGNDPAKKAKWGVYILVALKHLIGHYLESGGGDFELNKIDFGLWSLKVYMVMTGV